MKPAGQRVIRSRAGRRGSSPEQSGDATLRSASSVFRLILHFSFCIASLVLGFRLSRESLLVVVNLRSSEAYTNRANYLPSASVEFAEALAEVNNTSVKLSQELLPLADLKPSGLYHEDGVKSSRVHVGRHGILIRPWPHPDPEEILTAHILISRVQQEQRKLYGLIQRRKPVIVVTPTFRRTFQKIHLFSLKNTLMLVPGQVSWIVVEAGGRSTETAEILSNSGLNVHHLHLTQPMPAAWPKRRNMETLLRLRGLRFIKERQLEGVVVFADESNSHRLELFDEAQRVHWFGALSVGLLMPPKSYEKGDSPSRWSAMDATQASAPFLPVQGPACNASGFLVGWHSEYGTLHSVDGKSRTSWNFEWSGFVFNSAVLFELGNRPSWIKDWDEWANERDNLGSPTVMVSDEAFIEPLGGCGRDILVWWARSEARADSKYPEGWVLDPQLEIIVPSKHTPWPEPSPPPPPVIKTSVEESHEKKRQGRHRNQGKRNSKKQDS
ncbi:hypothetical protein Mapa_013806 [Marchantia paleacea]|nr:hypothetical protein Mapa_013806 [Marchantia paleacea]